MGWSHTCVAACLILGVCKSPSIGGASRRAFAVVFYNALCAMYPLRVAASYIVVDGAVVEAWEREGGSAID